MPFEPGIVAEVQARVDLLAYVSQYVTLKKRGREYVGLCPFHAEKTPSFSLNAEKQLWHCYGCDAGGDLLKFVQRYENVDFSTALRMLAQRAGVELHESADATRRRSDREAIYEANGIAQAYFASSLRKDDVAQGYLRQRGIAGDTAAKFGVGFAPDSWDGLAASLKKSGVELELAERAGLVRARPQGDGYYDFFRNRLMLPVYNLTGEVMAFGGRALGDEPPKYLNTPSTPAYTKGRHVYALNLARRAAAADGALIVVEGYLDAIGLHQAGFANTVASLGTAFTPEQARELHRVASNLYLCFDGDAAGQAATARSIDMLVDEGLTVEVVALPPGKDPDDFVRDEGAPAFKALLHASVPWKDFKLEIAFARSETKFASKSDVAKEVMRVVAQERDPIVRDQYVKAIARRLDISEHVLRKIDLGGHRPPPRPESPRGEQHRRAPHALQALSVERELIQLLFARPSFVALAAARVATDEFDDPPLAHVYRLLLEHGPELTGGLNPLTLFSDDPMGGELALLALSSPPLSIDDDEQRLGRLLERFDRRRMERRLSTVDEELNLLLTHRQPVPDTLRDEYNALAASLRGHKTSGKEG
jgi:DNA primase